MCLAGGRGPYLPRYKRLGSPGMASVRSSRSNESHLDHVVEAAAGASVPVGDDADDPSNVGGRKGRGRGRGGGEAGAWTKRRWKNSRARGIFCGLMGGEGHRKGRKVGLGYSTTCGRGSSWRWRGRRSRAPPRRRRPRSSSRRRGTSPRWRRGPGTTGGAGGGCKERGVGAR